MTDTMFASSQIHSYTNTLKDQQDLWVKEQFQDPTPVQTLNHKIKLEILFYKCIFFMNSSNIIGNNVNFTTSLLHWGEDDIYITSGLENTLENTVSKFIK